MSSEEDELALLSVHARRRAAAIDGRPIDILEAGCGRRWRVDLGDAPRRIVGVDLDATALALRVEREHDLDETIVGDLRTLAMPAESFDLVYCSFVLEHVHGAEQVLDRFVTWLRPGGLLLLRIPDRDSVYGAVTRHTPHRAHVAFRRHVIGMPGAGTAGHGPYPVVYDPVVSRRGVHEWVRRRGLHLVAEQGSCVYLSRSGRWAGPLRAGVTVVGRLSRGRLAHDHNNLALVVARPPVTVAAPS